MLEIRPSCEHCAVELSPDSDQAMICTYECTFCRQCVEGVLRNVCPNCAGGFTPRPVRPAREWISGVFLGKQPASTKVVHKPVDLQKHQALYEKIGPIDPHNR